MLDRSGVELDCSGGIIDHGRCADRDGKDGKFIDNEVDADRAPRIRNVVM